MWKASYPLSYLCSPEIQARMLSEPVCLSIMTVISRLSGLVDIEEKDSLSPEQRLLSIDSITGWFYSLHEAGGIFLKGSSLVT